MKTTCPVMFALTMFALSAASPVWAEPRITSVTPVSPRVGDLVVIGGSQFGAAPGPNGQRWVSMDLPGGGTSINLTTFHENMKPGTMKLYLSTPDIGHTTAAAQSG